MARFAHCLRNNKQYHCTLSTKKLVEDKQCTEMIVAICSGRPSQFIVAVIDRCRQPIKLGDQSGWAPSRARWWAGLDGQPGWAAHWIGRATELADSKQERKLGPGGPQFPGQIKNMPWLLGQFPGQIEIPLRRPTELGDTDQGRELGPEGPLVSWAN